MKVNFQFEKAKKFIYSSNIIQTKNKKYNINNINRKRNLEKKYKFKKIN